MASTFVIAEVGSFPFRIAVVRIGRPTLTVLSIGVKKAYESSSSLRAVSSLVIRSVFVLSAMVDPSSPRSLTDMIVVSSLICLVSRSAFQALASLSVALKKIL